MPEVHVALHTEFPSQNYSNVSDLFNPQGDQDNQFVKIHSDYMNTGAPVVEIT